jgi:hypothetical protein
MPTETRYGMARIVAESNELEFERYEDASDVILPFYRLPLTGEHLAAWASSVLRNAGCTCKRLAISTVSSGVKRATRKDAQLVYYNVDTDSVTLVRQGREWTVSFHQLSPSDEIAIIHFITDLVCEDPPRTELV